MISADKIQPGSWILSWPPAVKVLTLLFVSIVTALTGYAQLNTAMKSVGDLAKAADLTVLAVDIVETTSYTADKLKSCKNELNEIQRVLDSKSAIKYLAANDRREWAKEIKIVSMNIQLYSTILKNVLNRLDQVKTSLGKQDSDAITNLVSSVGGAVSTAFGGDSNSGTQQVVDAVDRVSSDVQKSTLQETLVSILLKLDDFNKNIDQIVIKTNMMSETIGTQLGFGLLSSLPSRSISNYRTLQIK